MHIFIHIPKCAGTSFNTLLTRAYGREYVYHLPSSVIDDGSNHVNSHPGLAEVRLFRGHFVYGMHKVFKEEAKYFTLLREPLPRIDSYLNHMASEAQLNAYDQGRYYEAVRNWESAEQHFRIHPRPIDNFMTRALSGIEFPPGQCSQEALEKACSHLDEMPAFGIFERLNESAVLIARRFNWRSLPVLSRTKSGHRKSIHLSDADRDFLFDLNRFDKKLYEHAYRRFEALVADEPGAKLLGEFYRAMTPTVTLFEKLMRASFAQLSR